MRPIELTISNSLLMAHIYKRIAKGIGSGFEESKLSFETHPFEEFSVAYYDGKMVGTLRVSTNESNAPVGEIEVVFHPLSGFEEININIDTIIDPASSMDEEPQPLTDLEKFIETYKQFGIDLQTNEEDDHIVIFLGDVHSSEYKVTESEKFDGYRGFASDVKFTKEGKFISQGFWE